MSHKLAKSILNRYERYDIENFYRDLNFGYIYPWQNDDIDEHENIGDDIDEHKNIGDDIDIDDVV